MSMKNEVQKQKPVAYVRIYPTTQNKKQAEAQKRDALRKLQALRPNLTIAESTDPQKFQATFYVVMMNGKRALRKHNVPF